MAAVSILPRTETTCGLPTIAVAVVLKAKADFRVVAEARAIISVTGVGTAISIVGAGAVLITGLLREGSPRHEREAGK